MGYMTQNWPNWPRSTLNKVEPFPDYVESFRRNYPDNYLVRTGGNHTHDNATVPGYERYSFSKDGKTVRIHVGPQAIPVRRFRWVGPRHNRRKQYYIVHIIKQQFITVPRPNYSYRSATLPKGMKGILQPNPLNTRWSDEISFEARQFSFVFKNPSIGSSLLVETSANRALRGKFVDNYDADFSQREPFTVINYDVTSSMRSYVENAALRGLYERVASRFPDVGTMVGESKESLRMLRDLANAGADFLGDLLKRDKARLLGRLKAPADFASKAWLTYIYGITPLINDVVSLSELPNQYGIRTYTKKESFSMPMYPYGPVADKMSEWISNFEYRFDVRYGVIMSADLKGSQRYAAMNLTNPIGVGYQLIPFSFMLDWFYDLGGFLNSQSALQYGFLYGWKTVTINKTWIDFQSNNPNSPSSVYRLPESLNNLPYRKTLGSCVRTVLSKNQFPMMPTPKLELVQSNPIRGLNVLAIAVQMHKDIKKP